MCHNSTWDIENKNLKKKFIFYFQYPTWNYDVLYYQFLLHLVLKKTITHNNFSTCASLFLDILHLKIEFHIVVHHFCILYGYYVHIMQISNDLKS